MVEVLELNLCYGPCSNMRYRLVGGATARLAVHRRRALSDLVLLSLRLYARRTFSSGMGVCHFQGTAFQTPSPYGGVSGL